MLNRNVVKDILKRTGQWIVQPFGQVISVGDVVEKDEYANLHVLGSASTVLQLGTTWNPHLRTGSADGTFYGQSSTEQLVKAAASASTPVVAQGVTDGRAKLNVAFDHDNAWIVAATGCSTESMDNEDGVRKSIVESARARDGRWQEHYGLVTSVMSVDSGSVTSSTMGGVSVELDVGATVGLPELGLGLALNPALTRSTQGVTLEKSTGGTFSVAVIGVKPRWWLPPQIEGYKGIAVTGGSDDLANEALAAEDFWQGFVL
jgi:hypothetical protein